MLKRWNEDGFIESESRQPRGEKRARGGSGALSNHENDDVI